MGHIIASIFENYFLFICLVIFISSILWCQTRRFNLGFIDSINFFWVFTFGTSYAVVVFLYLNDYISNYYFYIILFYYVIISFAIWIGTKIPVPTINRMRFSDCFIYIEPRQVIFILLLIYFMLFGFYISKIDFSIFFLSRFEANSGGLGIVSRYMDVIRLFIISYISVFAFAKKSWSLYGFLVFFSIVSSFVNGAKFAVIESIYVMFIASVLYYSMSFRLFTIRRLFPLLVIILIILIYVIYFLDRMAQGLGMISQYTNYPIWLEALLLRIIANGDMYYLSLPEGIIDSTFIMTQVSDWWTIFFRPLIGKNLTEILTGSQDSISVGRAIWLYHYPDSLSGGSVEHFDLDAYIHFGLWYGMFYVFVIGIYIGFINKIKMRTFKNKNKKNILFIMFFSYIYNKSYVFLLSPTAGFSVFFDGVVIMVLFILILGMIRCLFTRKGSLRGGQ